MICSVLLLDPGCFSVWQPDSSAPPLSQPPSAAGFFLLFPGLAPRSLYLLCIVRNTLNTTDVPERTNSLYHSTLPLMCSSISCFSWYCKYFIASGLSWWSPPCQVPPSLQQLCWISAKHDTYSIRLATRIIYYRLLNSCGEVTCVLPFIFSDSSLLFSHDWLFTICRRGHTPGFSNKLSQSPQVLRKHHWTLVPFRELPAGVESALPACRCCENHFPPVTSLKFGDPWSYPGSLVLLPLDTSGRL